MNPSLNPVPAEVPETAKNKGTRAHHASQDNSRFGNAPVSIRPLAMAAAIRVFSFLNIWKKLDHVVYLQVLICLIY